MPWVKNIEHKFLQKRRPLRLVFVKSHFERGLRILPNLFTLGNASFGFCSIIFAAYGELVAAAYFILLGALMDALDGRIARLVRGSSDFGIQLDSLGDAITFCLAPAFLAYIWQLKRIGFLGLFVCTLFLLAGLLRLARFNITHSQQYAFFLGIPTTIAGCFLATIVINTHIVAFDPISTVFYLLLVLTLAGLMISSIPFPALKQLPQKTYALGFIGFWAIVITMGLSKVLLLIFVGYFLLSFEEYLRKILQTP